MEKTDLKRFGIEYNKFLLCNGSEVRLLKRIGSPIHIQACIKAGSRYNNIAGQAHFVEHILVSSTSSFKDKLALNNALDAVGGTLEASTDRDFIRVTLSIPSKDSMPVATNILNEILTPSIYTEQIFKNEQSIILREIEDRKHNSSLFLMDNLLEKLYPEAISNVLNLGTKDSVSKITSTDILDYISNQITSNKITYVISGDVNIEDFEDSLAKINLPRGNDDLLTPPNKTIADSKIYHLDSKNTNSEVIVGFRCDTNSIEELVSLYFIQLMSTGRTSRLIQELRYKSGLVYDGNTLLWSFNQTSILTIKTSMDRDKTSEVIAIILHLIQELVKNGVNEATCETLKIKSLSQFIFNHQTSRQWLDAEVLALRHTPDTTDDLNALSIINQMYKIDSEIITKNIRKFLAPSNAYIVTTGEMNEQQNVQILNMLTK